MILSRLNAPQREAVKSGRGAFLVVSGPGSGKTHVIVRRIAHLVNSGIPAWKIIAITFTNKAAEELRKRLSDLLSPEDTKAVWAKTFHATCLAMLRRDADGFDSFLKRGLKRDFTVWGERESWAALRSVVKEVPNGDMVDLPSVKRTISLNKSLGYGVDGYRAHMMENGTLDKNDVTNIDIWSKYQALAYRSNALDFGDLELWGAKLLREEPEKLAYWRNRLTWLLIDEYQDTSPIQYQLIRSLAGKNGNIMVVGDPDQCLVAGSLIRMADGSCIPIEEIKEGDKVLSCWGSGTFRPSEVNRVHRSQATSCIAIQTASGKRIVSTPEHIHFVGFKSGYSPQLHMTYIMWKDGIGFRIGTTRTYTENRMNTLLGPAVRLNGEHADAAWIIGTYDSEIDARYAEVMYSLKYSIPTLPFKARPSAGSNKESSLVGDQNKLSDLFRDLNTGEKGLRLLKDQGLSFSHPHFSTQTTTNGSRIRRCLNVVLCGEQRGGAPRHRISLSGCDDAGRKIVEELGLSVRSAKGSESDWRFETVRVDFGDLKFLVDWIQEALDVTVKCSARIMGQGRTSLPFQFASAVRPGMVMVDDQGEPDVVISSEQIYSEFDVYDLDVANTHNFIADGIVTHNSIYGFRGANIGNIMSFEKDFPGAKVIRLEQNYRSTKNVLRVADALIKHNEERREKDLWTENAEGSAIELHEFSDQETEARFAVNEIIRREDLENKRTVAILFRVNAQSRPFEEVLVRERLPYILLGGLRFYERMEVQDVLGYVRQMENPNDVVSFRRILNVPKRGLGKVTEDRVVEEAGRRGSTPLQALEALLQGGSLGKRAEGSGKAFLKLMEGMTKKALTLPPGDIVRMILTDTGYAEHLQSLKTDEAEDRLENLFELERVASGFGTIKDFLEHVALYEGAGPADMKDPHVVVSTCHRAKGTEFDTVFVVGLAEGLLPHSRSMGRIEEERRLCYVAMTRAKDTLILTRPKSMWSWDGASRKNLNPSRFLKEAGL